MIKNVKLLFYAVFTFWCIDATNLYAIFEISEPCESMTSDAPDDGKLKGMDTKYNVGMKKIFFFPPIQEDDQCQCLACYLPFKNIFIEINSPPPEFLF